MNDWKSLTLGEIAAYMEQDPSFTFSLRTSRSGARADGVRKNIEFQGDGASSVSVLRSIIDRERP